MKKELDDIGAVIVTDRASKLQPPASSRPAILWNMHTIVMIMAIPIVTLVIFVIVLLLCLLSVPH